MILGIYTSVLVSANGAFRLVYTVGFAAGASCFVKALVTGNTDANAKVGVTVYNGTNLVYADTTIADGSGYYEFAPALSAGTYSVIANGKTTTLTVE